MNFFGLQDSARKESMVLLSLFALAMVIFGAVISQIALVISIPFQWIFYDFNPRIAQGIIVGFIWLSILYKCFQSHSEINQGGEALAEKFGAVKLNPSTQNSNERELINAIEEMAVASSQTVLPCFVFSGESGINALVLGKQNSPALVVTQGVLNQLSREERTAVVAHEYAHVANLDLKLNMRMLTALAGLNAITEYGNYIIKSVAKSSKKQHSGNPVDFNFNNILVFKFLVACFLLMVGSTSALFGDLIKAAFSRKRELLADAKAVQYTRDAWGLASVLDKSSDHPGQRSLDSIHCRNLEHLCLRGPWQHKIFSGFFANHPSPEYRISKLQKNFKAIKRSRNRMNELVKTEPKTKNQLNASGFSNTLTGIPIQQFEQELALVLSVMVGMAGDNREKSIQNFKMAMRSYTSAEHEYHCGTETAISAEFNAALQTLLNQSPAQRQALCNHLNELMDHDGIHTPEEKKVFDFVCQKMASRQDAA